MRMIKIIVAVAVLNAMHYELCHVSFDFTKSKKRVRSFSDYFVNKRTTS